MTLYGLRHKKTKHPLGVNYCSNEDATDCVSTEFSLYEYSYSSIPIWLVSSKGKADQAKEQNTPWFNANYENPKHGSVIIEDYEVFEINVPC